MEANGSRPTFADSKEQIEIENPTKPQKEALAITVFRVLLCDQHLINASGI